MLMPTRQSSYINHSSALDLVLGPSIRNIQACQLGPVTTIKCDG